MALPRPGMTCTLAAASRPEARQKPSAIAITTASCRPSTKSSCGESGTTSMMASSVVPGLPKRCVTPSSTRSCRKAARPVNVPNVLTVNPQVIDAHDVRELIEKVKASPGRYNYASTGNGTGTHLAFAEFNYRAGLEMVHIPYKGGPEALASVVSGQT